MSAAPAAVVVEAGRFRRYSRLPAGRRSPRPVSRNARRRNRMGMLLDYRRDGAFAYELHPRRRPYRYREFVKGPYDAGRLDAIDQEHPNRSPVRHQCTKEVRL